MGYGIMNVWPEWFQRPVRWYRRHRRCAHGHRLTLDDCIRCDRPTCEDATCEQGSAQAPPRRCNRCRSV